MFLALNPAHHIESVQCGRPFTSSSNLWSMWYFYPWKSLGKGQSKPALWQWSNLKGGMQACFYTSKKTSGDPWSDPGPYAELCPLAPTVSDWPSSNQDLPPAREWGQSWLWYYSRCPSQLLFGYNIIPSLDANPPCRNNSGLCLSPPGKQ